MPPASASPSTESRGSVLAVGRPEEVCESALKFCLLWLGVPLLAALFAGLESRFSPAVGPEWAGPWGSAWLGACVGLGCTILAALAWRLRLPRWSLGIAAALLVLQSAACGVHNALYAASARELTVRPTWDSLLVLVFALVVVAPLRFHLLCLLAAPFAVAPAAAGLAASGLFADSPHDLATLAQRTMLVCAPTWICALIGALGAMHAQRMRQRLREARRDLDHALGRLAQLGSYQLEARLSSGGMGEVWRARHRVLARPAAIKLIHAGNLRASDAAERERWIARFEREAQITAQLTSAHTVQIYDFGRAENGRLYYVMELLDGEDLAEVLRRHGALPDLLVARVLAQACDSLGEAHAHGLVHRDIKPANLVLCRLGLGEETLKVVDFGLAIEVDGLTEVVGNARTTRQGVISGTPLYMSPEQILNTGTLDGRADIYSLGCVAYQLLSGRPPVTGGNVRDILMAHLNSDPPPLTGDHGRAAHPGLVALIMRMLAKDRSQRPDAAAVAEALRQLDLRERPEPLLGERPAEPPPAAPGHITAPTMDETPGPVIRPMRLACQTSATHRRSARLRQRR